MSDRSKEQNKNSSPEYMPDKGKGMQGIDKAPGEEPARDTINVTRDAQKGKTKVDGDPSKESDRSIEQ